MAITSNKYGMEELKTLVSSFSNLVLRDYSNNGYKELLFEDNQYTVFTMITLYNNGFEASFTQNLEKFKHVTRSDGYTNASEF